MLNLNSEDTSNRISYYRLKDDFPFLRELKYQENYTEYFFKDTIVKGYNNIDDDGCKYVSLVKLPPFVDLIFSAKEEFVPNKFLEKLNSEESDIVILIDAFNDLSLTDIRKLLDNFNNDK